MTPIIDMDNLYWPRTNNTGRVIELLDVRGGKHVILPGARMILPKQVDGLNAIRVYKIVANYGGMGRGGSRWMRMAIIDMLLEWGMAGHRNVRGTIINETLKLYAERHKPFLQNEYRDIGTMNKTTGQFTLHEEYGENYIIPTHAEDPDHLKSMQYAIAALEEMANQRKDIFDMALDRLRWDEIDHCPLIGASNTTGVGAGWVEDELIIHPRATRTDRFGKKRYGTFAIHATPLDNPTLSEDIITQYSQTEDEDRRKAYFEGLFGFGEGQAFHLIDGVHIVPRMFAHGKCTIPPDWILFGGLDFGFLNSNAFVAEAVNPRTGQGRIFGVVSVAGLSALEAKKETYDYFKSIGKPIESFDVIVADPSGTRGTRGSSGKSMDRSKTDWEKFNNDEGATEEEPIPSFRLRRAANDRHAGVSAVRNVLACKWHWKDNIEGGERIIDREPGCVIEEHCAPLITSIRWMRVKKNDPKDVEEVKSILKPGMGDDEFTAWRYLVMASHQGRYQKESEPVAVVAPRDLPREARTFRDQLKSYRGSKKKQLTWG